LVVFTLVLLNAEETGGKVQSGMKFSV
jgi:hypothetical protein